MIYGGLICVFLTGLLKREERSIKQATRNHLIPRAEIERKVAQLMNANREATDEQVNEMAQLYMSALLDISDLLAEIAVVVETTGKVRPPVDRRR